MKSLSKLHAEAVLMAKTEQEKVKAANSAYGATFDTLRELTRAIEAAHGIKEKNT